MLWYNVGKVAVTLNNKTVTGTGTSWLANVRNGDAFRGPDGQIYLVENVATNTSLTISPAYASASGTGKDYAIMPVQGYQRDLADRVLDLISNYGVLGTAAYGTVTESNMDSTSGRVSRIGDWGLGVTNGVHVGTGTALQDTNVNGFYRSGASDPGKPPNSYSGDGYLKMGWSTTYKTLLYASPSANKLWFQNIDNGTVKAWKEVMHVGHSGLGLAGADRIVDAFPGSDLSTLNAGAGIYWYLPEQGAASDLPFGTTYSDTTGTVFHRQSGSVGAQIAVSASGRLAWRGRTSSNYGGWKKALAEGDYGWGAATAAPGSWESQRTGWYYRPGAKPTWGGGGFFLDLAYNNTDFNSGLRISTDPYTDNFYMNGGVSGQKTFRDACKLVHDKNIVGSISSGSVIEAGFNANGKWAKFADGTLICWSGVLMSNWIDRQSGSVYVSVSSEWTLPMAFLNAENYVLLIEPTWSNEPIWGMVGDTKTASTCKWKLAASFAWNQPLGALLTAIGRWKA